MNYNIGQFHEGLHKELEVILVLTLNSVESGNEHGHDTKTTQLKIVLKYLTD